MIQIKEKGNLIHKPCPYNMKTDFDKELTINIGSACCCECVHHIGSLRLELREETYVLCELDGDTEEVEVKQKYSLDKEIEINRKYISTILKGADRDDM